MVAFLLKRVGVMVLTALCLTAIVFARLGYVFRQKPSGLPEPKPSFRLFW